MDHIADCLYAVKVTRVVQFVRRNVEQRDFSELTHMHRWDVGRIVLRHCVIDQRAVCGHETGRSNGRTPLIVESKAQRFRYSFFFV